MKSEVKIGIIGMGSRGCACFGKLLSERKDSKITAICDINPVRLEAAAADLDHPKTYLKAEDMLKEEKLDAVIITVPDFLHEEMAILGLESNVNVLIDKPLATTAAGCKRIMAAAAKSKKTIMIGFNLRHQPVLKKAKSIIDSGILGRIIMIDNREYYSGGRTYMGRWNRDKSKCGSLWIHKGSHDFDIFDWLLNFPKPKKVVAFSGMNYFTPENLPFTPREGEPAGPRCAKCPYYDKECPDGKVYDEKEWGDKAIAEDGYVKDNCLYLSKKDIHDNGFAMVEYENGIRVSHMECFITNLSERFYSVIGTKAQADFCLSKYEVTVTDRTTGEKLIYQIPQATGSHNGADPNLVESFVNHIKQDSSSVITAEQGLLSSAIGQAAEISKMENRVVMMNELLDD